MSVPQKHHYVPQFLLRRFADTSKKLLVHHTDKEERPGRVHVGNLAQTFRGHTLYWPGREPDHATIESGMGSIETHTGRVVADLLAGGARSPAPDQREVLGFFIALQWQRSRFLIDLLVRSVLAPDAPVNELERSLGIRQIMHSVLFPWFARLDGEIDPGETACYVADWLQYGPWQWRLYRPDGPKLIVGDNIVCLWGLADGETSEMPEPWTHHGVGVGFGNCGRVTMPLAPNLGLIIHRDGRPDLRNPTAAEFNRATVYSSREFVAHHPEGLPSADLQRALREDLGTQRQLLPIIIEAARRAAEEDARQSDRLFQQLSETEPKPFF
ncbi:Protein of unknown function [Amycolatopsis pretoriensis]|uniref:DUF4238 domain-containing protein n=1 Tax=Amycolatopsis pretoriensis TaxID=218821 RepID=A0A1H5RJ90_9PSEU|nr:DUF4238 domain-containing protein [Amycolatopsis pretoriensis]SEF38416.1 Protein of unknown function [Amycolatopsis pretoriensis]